MKKIGVMFSIMLGAIGFANAQKPAVVTSNEKGWQHIGQVSASFKSQTESIEVIGADEFTSIKIKVSEAPLHIDQLKVVYESGAIEEINVRSQINEGTETRVINLKHPDRDIARVTFTYHTVANSKGEKADVQLYGLKTNQPAGADTYRDEKEEMKEDAREAKEDAKEATQSAGDKVSEGVNDAAAAIADQKLKHKVGPGGETVYLDDNAKYYYINNQGKKVFITKAQLRDKPE
ncbi:DUF2541 family protein [Pseudochryseolinea flava]|uniref:Uncharacterized protein n=1 Tax=Pseudochryseolinea flava TaxID=2059302 RepID=A0A364Y134_9BACT|nr:DUF2541 family protein [Pseudochryseolinea flava]RAV99992.1 hypothetical protein DQQ10_15655 [Pseudochryseolinea flava]